MEPIVIAIMEQYGRATQKAPVGLFLIGCGPGAAEARAGRRDGRAATIGAAAPADWVLRVRRMIAPPAWGRAGAWGAGVWAMIATGALVPSPIL